MDNLAETSTLLDLIQQYGKSRYLEGRAHYQRHEHRAVSEDLLARIAALLVKGLRA
jgi:hypothetical protein